MLVDPCRARFRSCRNALRPADVPTRYRAAEAILGGVGARERIFHIPIFDNWQRWAKLLLIDDIYTVFDVVKRVGG